MKIKPSDIRDCPFCKEPIEIVEEKHIYPEWLKYSAFHIRCKNFRCGVRPGVNKPKLELAIEAWNRGAEINKALNEK